MRPPVGQSPVTRLLHQDTLDAVATGERSARRTREIVDVGLLATHRLTPLTSECVQNMCLTALQDKTRYRERQHMTHILSGCTTDDGRMEGIKIAQRIAHPTPFLSSGPRLWCRSTIPKISLYLARTEASKTVPVVDDQWTLVSLEENGNDAV